MKLWYIVLEVKAVKLSVLEYLEETANKFPKKIAISDNNEFITYNSINLINLSYYV